MTQARKWSLLATLLVAAIFVGSWFLLVAPRRSEAADLRSQAKEQVDANARLVQKLEMLKAQAEDLPAQRARLAQVRRQIPDNPALPALIRDLSAGAKKSGTDLLSLAPSLPVAVVAQPGTITATPTPAGTTTTATATTPAAGGESAPAVSSSLFQVPIVVKVSGTYFEVEQFVNKVEDLKRSFLVTGFTLTPKNDDADLSGSAQMLELTLNGRVYLSPESAAPAASQPTPTSAVTTAPAN